VLKISGVHTFYGHIEALKGVDIEINEGEIVTLIGANGAGKSTLLMTICGNPQARSGRIEFLGNDISRCASHEIIAVSRRPAHLPVHDRVREPADGGHGQ